ncbi:hypothetical protein FACS189450_01650 [Spirochaetia bacterium]|nr:hypothetical protein FACS189450_01650 [Spirochaetia bacterium]
MKIGRGKIAHILKNEYDGIFSNKRDRVIKLINRGFSIIFDPQIVKYKWMDDSIFYNLKVLLEKYLNYITNMGIQYTLDNSVFYIKDTGFNISAKMTLSNEIETRIQEYYRENFQMVIELNMSNPSRDLDGIDLNRIINDDIRMEIITKFIFDCAFTDEYWSNEDNFIHKDKISHIFNIQWWRIDL